MKQLLPDSQAILLLCSRLAFPKAQHSSLQPLTPSEWNDLAAALLSKRLRPSALLAMNAEALQTEVGVKAEAAGRLVQLLARGGQLAIDLERLGSLGIWPLTRADDLYPVLLKERLGVLAPPVLFGSGDPELLARGFLAVVGSRDVEPSGERFAQEVGVACAREGHTLVSGGARGVDRIAMAGALQSGGRVIGVLADSLERVIREPELREALAARRLVVVSAVHPKAPFSVASAMARNKLIYCLARHGMVVSSSLEKGGTRAGALEVLKHRWVPMFVRNGPQAPAGNQDLIARGALAFPPEEPAEGLAQFLLARAGAWLTGAPPRERKSLRESSQQKAAVTEQPDDLFPLVWPHIEARLGRWATVEELASRLQVEVSQVRQWMDRAKSLGLAKPARGALHASQSRFDL